MLDEMRVGVEDLKRDRDERRTQAQALRLALPQAGASTVAPPIT
jgi:hypothetical protein